MQHVVLIGSQRSGTTLAGQVLGAHPHTLLIDEPDGLYYWAHVYFRKGECELSQSLFRRCCITARTKYRQPADRVGEDGTLHPSVTHLVLKAPNLTWYPEEVAEYFPGTVAVCLVRDVRDVVVSMREHPIVLGRQVLMMTQNRRLLDWRPELVDAVCNPLVPDIVKMAIVATTKMVFVEHFRAAGVPVLTIRYEDLVRQPDRVVPALLRHARLPLVSGCLEPSHVLQGEGPGGTVRTRRIDETSVGRWRVKLAPHEEELVWAAVGGLMAAIGYERGEVGWSSVSRETRGG